MPYTRREVKFLFSSGSPLTAEQKAKMESELHADPALGHETKGSATMKRGPRADTPKKKRAPKDVYAYDWRQHQGQV